MHLGMVGPVVEVRALAAAVPPLLAVVMRVEPLDVRRLPFVGRAQHRVFSFLFRLKNNYI